MTTTSKIDAIGLTKKQHRNLRARGSFSALSWIGLVLIFIFLALAIVGPLVTGDPSVRVGGRLEPPSAEFWFGTDNLARDLLARSASGALVSLQVGFASVLLGLLIAVPLGIVSGYYGGRWVDDLIQRVLDTLQALPLFVFALFVLGMLGTGESKIGFITLSPTTKVVLLLAVSFLPSFARVTRSATLVEVEQEYVAGLRVLGVPRHRIVLRELLPNVVPPVLVQGFLWVGIAIFAESALSFLGLGIQPPQASLGSILSDATGYLMVGAWWYSVIPGAIIMLVTVGINLVGDGVANLMDRRQ